MPKVSVVLPVKNVEKHIYSGIESILKQTLQDFEILVMDDRSTDRTIDIIKQFDDPRIIIFNCTDGFINNLNDGFRYAKANLIARMDGDDLMNSSRLYEQWILMESKPEITVCASRALIFNDDTRVVTQLPFGDNEGMIYNPLLLLLNGNFICHPTTMIRKSFLIKNEIKYCHEQHIEDYNLWFQIAKRKGEFYVIPKELLLYRISGNQVSNKYSKLMRENSLKLQCDIARHLVEELSQKSNVNLKSIVGELIHLVTEGVVDFQSISNLISYVCLKTNDKKLNNGKMV